MGFAAIVVVGMGGSVGGSDETRLFTLQDAPVVLLRPSVTGLKLGPTSGGGGAAVHDVAKISFLDIVIGSSIGMGDEGSGGRSWVLEQLRHLENLEASFKQLHTASLLSNRCLDRE